MCEKDEAEERKGRKRTMKTLCPFPFVNFPVSIKQLYAVKVESGKDDASSNETLLGFLVRSVFSTTAYSARTPCPVFMLFDVERGQFTSIG
jgi:hypothetical protein